MTIQEPETHEEREISVQEALQRAEKLRKKKAYKEGIDLLVEVLKYGVNREAIYYRLGNLYIDGGDLSRAEYAYKRAIEVDPHHANAMHNLAIVYKRQHKTSLYVETYKKSQQLRYLHPRSAGFPSKEKRRPPYLNLKFLLWGLAAAGIILLLILFLR